MRLTSEQIHTIKQATAEIFGEAARVRLFGSRTDDRKRGGDVDLLVEADSPIEDETWLAARLSARVSRSMQGRRVDVLVQAPGIREQPIHRIARREGIAL
ncbi:nucleotidyltransferase domain-containing protein [Wenzhouxiangella limi]|uniref:Nucleotidyltransferase domain-containing protein n=1 Tax=Wenzhouxiangella limi TaxID=2707351 RepID=A0A845V4A7_9GAMM|nr:nucleotidyltransferase domain-containing protein [Wenzhouxiangella limi]NDY97130.1 nucleotidyltransferase domain-containing protein [Wenzhouxiangella limi]